MMKANEASGPPGPQLHEAADQEKRPLSRRRFLQASGAVVTGAIALTTVSCGEQGTPHTLPNAPVARVPLPEQYPAVPYPPATIPEPGILQFFTPHEAQVVEALTARILPGTPEDPGAREAGVVYYIDNMLAYQDGLPEPTYRQPPHAQTYQGDEPPATNNGYQVIWVAEDQIERYGYQSVLTPRDVFRIGVAAVDRYANERFGSGVLDVSEEQQDQLITALLDNEATGFDPLTPEALFHALRRYTNEGMFSDSVYGGNRNFVGWRLIGYPGAQRAYLPDEIGVEGSGLVREIWSLADLPHFHPGQPVGPNVVLPVSGSKEQQ
jgi:hypothetical protein